MGKKQKVCPYILKSLSPGQHYTGDKEASQQFSFVRIKFIPKAKIYGIVKPDKVGHTMSPDKVKQFCPNKSGSTGLLYGCPNMLNRVETTVTCFKLNGPGGQGITQGVFITIIFCYQNYMS